VIAPSLTGKVGRQIHEAGALTGVAVLSSREHRQHVGQLWRAFPHGKSPETVRGHTTSLRRYGPGPPACAERTTLLLNQAYPTAILTSAADVATITGAASLGRLAIRTGSPPG
jgi:hypothetical protein